MTLLATLIAACGSAAEDAAGSGSSPEPAASPPAMAASASDSGVPHSPVSVDGAATIATADHDEYGALLTDGEGR